MAKIFLDTLKGNKKERIPFWYMRQAGRYLSEYKAARNSCNSFLDFCYTPEKASNVTIQPIDRFGMDAAILFSDILVIPDAMGAEVHFEPGKGPLLTPVITGNAVESLSVDSVDAHLAPIYETLKLIKNKLPEDKTLIGFAGAPWTIACYMIHGSGSKDFADVREFSFKQEALFSLLIDKITQATITYLRSQIKAGAEVIQLFDSWAGMLTPDAFKQWSIEPAKKIVSALKETHPDIPIIGFPKGVGVQYECYAEETGVNGLSVDMHMPLEWIRDHLQDKVVVQGNLDPILLASDREAMLIQAKKIIRILGNKAFIFNLGHGIVPHTPVENVQALSDLLRG
jgi:uroporphyrinogen decarboxylase